VTAPVEVTLTEAESRVCTWVGAQRHAAAVRERRDPGQGPSKSDLTPANHIRGAASEYAASIILNLSWRLNIGRIREVDVGGLVEVRSTDLERGCLIVKPQDKDYPFVLMIQNARRRFRFGGWMLAAEAKGWPLVTGRGDPAHFVPQQALGTVETLKARLLAG
jgi:hypothetical protein